MRTDTSQLGKLEIKNKNLELFNTHYNLEEGKLCYVFKNFLKL